jgi:TolR protein
MGMSAGGKGPRTVMSEINVTPLVDVMLVLLIIFMVVAPLLQKGVDVKLPQASNTTEKPETQGQTVLAVTADKRYYVNSVQVPERDLLTRVQEVLEDQQEKIILIKGDEDAPYSAIMTVMDELRKVGIEDIGLVTERRLRPGERAGGE